jgi:hypothetical protein
MWTHVEFIHLMWLFVVVYTKVVLDIFLLMSSSPKRPLCGSIYCLDISWFNFQQFFIKRVILTTKKIKIKYLGLCVVFCRSLFVLLSFFCWPLCCQFFLNLRIVITPLASSNFSGNDSTLYLI